MRCTVEDRELAEELAGSQDRDDRRLGTLLARQDDLDRPARNDEQGVARVALVEDRLAPSEPTDPEDAHERVDGGLVGRSEQPALAKRLSGGGVVGSGHPILLRSRCSAATRRHRTRCEAEDAARRRILRRMETVVCPSCGEDNPAKFRLCGFCGTSLVPAPETIRCASCGEENPAKFRLCGFCGTPLAAG